MSLAVDTASPRRFATNEGPQPATNDLDIGQGPLPKLDLRFKCAHVAKRGRGNNKTTHILLKPIQRGLYKIHFNLPRKNTGYKN